MDRRLLFLCAWIALGIWGCSSEKSPPTATAAAPVQAEMRATEVSSSEASREETWIGAAGRSYSAGGFGGGDASSSGVSGSAPSSERFGGGSPFGQSAIPLDP